MIADFKYPKTMRENVIYRIELTKACLKDKKLAADVWRYCSKNIIFWCDVFCWTKDPRKNPDVIPFICYEAYQPEAIFNIESAINNQEDLLLEKTRDMGASWMPLYVFNHKWLFEDGSDFKVGSRKEEYVDKPGDIDTLFEKLRFNISKQPPFLMPMGFNWDKHSTYMRLVNPANGNAIIGESANDNFGSGGRRKAVLIDEYAKWPNNVASAAWTSTADVTKCRIVVSTPVGSGNKYAMLAKGTDEKIKKLTLHWSLHPEKAKDAYYILGNEQIPIDISQDKLAVFKKWKEYRGKPAPTPLRGGCVRSPWYDAECERRNEGDIAQELDIDYLKSGRPFFDLDALSRQRAWEYLERDNHSDPIPYGKFIRVNIVETTSGKYEIRENRDGWLRLFEFPKSNYQYVLAGDVAEGLPKGDDSFGVVRDKLTGNVVAASHGKFDPDDWAVKLQKIGKYFNNAKVAPESNNHGHSVCSDLKQVDCNLYYTKRVSQNSGEVAIVRAGWTTDARTRPLILDHMREGVRKATFEIRCGVIIAQCETFVHNDTTGKAEADGDYKDDGVMACAIAGQVILEEPMRQPESYVRSHVKPNRERVNNIERPRNAKFSFRKRG